MKTKTRTNKAAAPPAAPTAPLTPATNPFLITKERAESLTPPLPTTFYDIEPEPLLNITGVRQGFLQFNSNKPSYQSFYTSSLFSSNPPQLPPYIRIPYTEAFASHLQISFVSKLYHHFIQTWAVRQPGLLLSVTGDAGGKLDLIPAAWESFSVGIAEVVQMTSAWVISGGSSGGVMSMMGQVGK